MLGVSTDAALFIATMGGSARTGSGPRALFSSNAQQAIVESQAGFKFTKTTIKRYVDPSRTVAASDLRWAVGGTPILTARCCRGQGLLHNYIEKWQKL